MRQRHAAHLELVALSLEDARVPAHGAKEPLTDLSVALPFPVVAVRVRVGALLEAFHDGRDFARFAPTPDGGVFLTCYGPGGTGGWRMGGGGEVKDVRLVRAVVGEGSLTNLETKGRCVGW